MLILYQSFTIIHFFNAFSYLHICEQRVTTPLCPFFRLFACLFSWTTQPIGIEFEGIVPCDLVTAQF